MNDFACHLIFPIGLLDAKGKLSVVEKNPFANFDICSKRFVVCKNNSILALSTSNFHHQGFPFNQIHLTPSNFAYSQFGPLQIRHHSCVGAQFSIQTTNCVDGVTVNLVIAVREVDSGNIEPLQNQLRQYLFGG